MVMRREKVSLLSGTVDCAGYLFLPEPQAATEERPPCVVLAHGLSGTMDRLVAHAERVAADDPMIVAVAAQIPFNGFPRRVEGRSTAAALRLFGAIVWDVVKGRLHLQPFYIPMIGRPGELAVATTLEADRHLQLLTGGDVATRWRNQVAPRGLLQMLRYRPALDAARLQAPLLVCAAEQDRETPVDTARALANAAPRGVLRVYPGTHFDFYTDPAIRDRALADQLQFLHQHLHTSSRVA
jgi:uncharacterized protein